MHPAAWLALAIGYFLFREVLDAVKIAGIGLIIAGVVMLNWVRSA